MGTDSDSDSDTETESVGDGGESDLESLSKKVEKASVGA